MKSLHIVHSEAPTTTPASATKEHAYFHMRVDAQASLVEPCLNSTCTLTIDPHPRAEIMALEYEGRDKHHDGSEDRYRRDPPREDNDEDFEG